MWIMYSGLCIVVIPFNRDPYIIHLSLYFRGKSHVSNGQNVSFKKPCSKLSGYTMGDAPSKLSSRFDLVCGSQKQLFFCLEEA